MVNDVDTECCILSMFLIVVTDKRSILEQHMY